MKKTGKILLGIGIGAAAACTCGLMTAGVKTGWGPFASWYDWDSEVRKIEQKYPAAEKRNEIVFYGASNFRLWTDMETDLSAYKVQNHGFGGSTDRLLVQYADRLLYPYDPEIVFFQTGSNDYVSMSGSDEEKADQCIAYKKQMFAQFHEKLPEAKFVVMSGLLLPGRSEYTELSELVNQKLKKLCDENSYLYFVNSSEMTFNGQKYREDLFRKDGIHLNHDGQLKWMKEYIQPQIESLITEFHLDHLRKEEK
jgi:lysophospholipase L1-like esterase